MNCLDGPVGRAWGLGRAWVNAAAWSSRSRRDPAPPAGGGSVTIKKLVLTAIVALALPAGAFAKGPSSASIQGPGLKTVTISGDGEDGGALLFGRLTESAGFFAAVFRPSPD